MKNLKLRLSVEAFYIFMMTVCSVFYAFADFSKVISRQLGYAQLLYSIFILIVFIVSLINTRKGIPIVFYVLYSIAQLVPIYYWIIFSRVNFNLFNGIKMSGKVGLPLHIILFCFGIYIAIIKKKSKIQP